MAADAPCAPGTAAESSSSLDGFISRRFWIILLICCLVAGACRIVNLQDQMRNNPFAVVPMVDAETYWIWSGEIAAGKIIGDEPFFSAPLYPYLLALVRAFGGGFTAVYWTHLIFHLATAIVLGDVIRKRFGPAVGCVAAVLFLSLAEPVIYQTRVLNCSLQLLIICLLWRQAVRAQARPSLASHVAVGAICGLLVLCYSPSLILLFLLAPWVYWTSRGRRRRPAFVAGASLATGLLVISPAVLHNVYVTGDLQFIQAAPAINWSQGYGPEALGVYNAVPGLTTDRTHLFRSTRRVFREAYGREGTWREIDAHFRKQTLDYILANPEKAAILAFKKLHMFLSARQYDDIQSREYEIEMGLSNFSLLSPLPTPWLIGPAMIALIPMFKKWRVYAPELALLLLPMFVVVVFWYSPRYRLPVIPVACLGASLVIVRAAQSRLKGAAGRAAFGALLLVYALELFRQDLDPTGSLQPPTQLAMAYLDLGRNDQAVHLFEGVVNNDPDSLEARLLFAEILLRTERTERAFLVIDGLKDKAGKLGQLRFLLAQARIQRGHADDLEAAAQDMLELSSDPTHRVRSLFLMGRAREKQGRVTEAISAYEALLRIEPDNPQATEALRPLREP